MSRTVSLTARTAFNAETTGEVPVFLITVDHDDLATPFRFSSDPTTRLSVDPLSYGTVSLGVTYNFLPIGMVMPDDSDEAPPAFRITIDNVAREMVPLLRSVDTPATVTIEMVLASDPDTIEVSWPEFDLIQADYDAQSVIIDLAIDSLVTEPYPFGRFSPSGFGGLF